MAKILDILRTQKWQNIFLCNQIKLYLKNQAVKIENVLSKNVCSEIRAGYETRPTAQSRFEEQFPDICLDWHDVYKLPFNVLIDTKSREFQYRILNRYLTATLFFIKLVWRIHHYVHFVNKIGNLLSIY